MKERMCIHCGGARGTGSTGRGRKRLGGALGLRRAWRRGWLSALILVSPAVLGQVEPTFTYNHVQFPQSPIPITEPDGSEATYGEKLVSMGGGRFAVSAPLMDVNIGARLLIRYQIDGGFVGIRDQDGLLIAGTAAPRSTLRHRYGSSLSAFPDGRLLVGAMDSTTNASGTFFEVGNVYLHSNGGQLLGTWPNPAGLTSQNFFGRAVAALGGNRFAASSRDGFGKVYLFDASAVGRPLVVITNPTPVELEVFGFSLAALGENRLLIGDLGDTEDPSRLGSVMIYDFAGTKLKTNSPPVCQEIRDRRVLAKCWCRWMSIGFWWARPTPTPCIWSMGCR